MRSLIPFAFASALTTSITIKADNRVLDPASLKNLTEAVVSLADKLIQADTTSPPGNEAKAVAILEKRIKEIGVPYEITEFAPNRKNIVARLKGNGAKRPLLLLAHLDTVAANPKEWKSNPRQLSSRDGYYFGRWILDDLGMAAAELEKVAVLKGKGLKLDRDIIVALTGDEESAEGAGVKYVLKHHPQQIDAEIALNEGGFLVSDGSGGVKSIELQYAEKIYCNFELTAHGPGGHSSLPLPDNSIYRMSEALARFGKFQFPIQLTPSLRAYLTAASRIESPEISKAMVALSRAKGPLPKEALETLEKKPAISSNLRTTCVATLINGGTRENALPIQTLATINCRMLPDQSLDDLQKKIVSVLADPSIEVKRQEQVVIGPSSPVESVVPNAVAKVGRDLWPQAPVIPTIFATTDARFTRSAGIATYGIFPYVTSYADLRGVHGVDERLSAAGLEKGLDFFYRLVVELTGAK